MILKKYPKYKSSKTEYLRDVPIHWEVKSIKYIISILTDFTANGSFASLAENVTYLDEGYSRLVRLTDLREDLNNTGIFVDEFAHSFLKKSELFSDDILIANVGAYTGFVCKVPTINYKATLGPNMYLLRFYKSVFPDYIYYLLSSNIYFDLFQLKAKSAAQPKINKDDLKEAIICIPTKNEQKTIAAYLDKETARIDALIAKKERQIELLQEKRQAIITRAITKGLDPKAKMKDSGVEWIGEIPEGWEVRRLKAVAPVQGGYAFKSESFQDEGVPVIRMNNLKRGEVWVEEAACVPSDSIPPEFLLAEDDILIGMSGSLGETGSLGNYAIVKSQDLPLALNQRVGRFCVNKRVFSIYFLKQIIQSKLFTEPISLFSNGTAQFNISSEQIGSVFIPYPPISVQVEIAKHCDLIIDSIKQIQEKLSSSVSLLREYRSSLITAAVSGQIDVSQEVAR